MKFTTFLDQVNFDSRDFSTNPPLLRQDYIGEVTNTEKGFPKTEHDVLKAIKKSNRDIMALIDKIEFLSEKRARCFSLQVNRR